MSNPTLQLHTYGWSASDTIPFPHEPDSGLNLSHLVIHVVTSTLFKMTLTMCIRTCLLRILPAFRYVPYFLVTQISGQSGETRHAAANNAWLSQSALEWENITRTLLSSQNASW